ncbi:helix-turn-helix transcriptional regulator, AraC family [Syntrophotalea carbinolica DSM 2380]|uniref:Helix-turn-helix transcriptional regulator, AraC family n=1 Tax=Syntrophotalea carbinolica (strain DSM 2380 / NBRC 103641 / GraBd1) TaxID=338963 RepID=Q3A5M5_SYNC1|nr:AraC family transcriptional regulator [Syntrophotalea carbinolica]ABA88332.1 helix-turn-helix transcriptional regulator, AraC family [Syntrophotalea carbinolica DSM 2380]
MKKQNVDGSVVALTKSEPLTALVADIARWTTGCGEFQTPVPGLTFYHHDQPTEPKPGLTEPSICLIAQGAKRIHLEDETFDYDAHRYLLASVYLPTTYQVISASPGEPYLGLVLKFDMRELSRLMIDSNLPATRTRDIDRCMSTGEVTLPLLSAFQRLVALVNEPEDIPILAPMLHREILYRLLVGDQGDRLRQIAASGSRSHQVARAIEWLKTNFAQQLRIDELAGMANMSASSFHSHFRAMTSLSPLQYQKHLRLQEARRLMLAEDLDATRAAFQVGYESSSQFSREYSRLFGAPPLRDVNSLRQAAVGDDG